MLGGFFRMIFEKINTIKTPRPGRKARLHREQGSKALRLSSPPRGTETGVSKSQWRACLLHRWTKIWGLVQQLQNQCPLPPHLRFCLADYCRQTWNKSRTNLNPSVPWVDELGGTTRSPFFSSKAVMCSRQKHNLGCFGPKETFTTKLYTSENKWAFILEGDPARLFIICTTIIKLVLISGVECLWVGQLAGSGGLSGDHFTLKNAQWETGGKYFSFSIFLRIHHFGVLYFFFLLACSLQLQSRLLFSFSFLFSSFLKIPGAFQRKT